MAAVGPMVRDLRLPEGVLLVAIERNGTTIIPRGTTVIEPEDTITILALQHQYHDVLQALSGSSRSPNQ
jgi:cell volume regulation protein A